MIRLSEQEGGAVEDQDACCTHMSATQYYFYPYSRKVVEHKNTHSRPYPWHNNRHYRRGHAWHSSILSHCKIFGTTVDARDGERADDVSAPPSSDAHDLDTPYISASWLALNTNFISRKVSTELLSNSTSRKTPGTTAHVAKSLHRVGCHGLVDRIRISTRIQTYDHQKSKTYIVIVIQRIQKSIT